MIEENVWENYYDATSGRQPRELLLETIKLMDQSLPKMGIDVGFGAGNETKYLLEQGWRVFAIDITEEAAIRLRKQVGENRNLQLVTNSFEKADYPSSSIVHAGFSLPFCKPEFFDNMWRKITSSLHSGGYFCGQLFGQNDEWKDRAEMTFHSRNDLNQLFLDFDFAKVEETDGMRKTATGQDKHWHFYDIIAKKK